MAKKAKTDLAPITPEEHRKLWKGSVVTPAGSIFEVQKCDLIEFLLFFISEEEVEEIMAKDLKERMESIKKVREQKFEQEDIMKKVCVQNSIKPKIVDGKPGKGELSYDELHPMERRYIMNFALSLPRFFRADSEKQDRKPRGRGSKKIRKAAE